MGNLKSTVELSVEGLPEGWTASPGYSHINDYRGPKAALGTKALLSITAPPNAKMGDLAEFHVVGRAETESGVIREARPYPHPLHVFRSPSVPDQPHRPRGCRPLRRPMALDRNHPTQR